MEQLSQGEIESITQCVKVIGKLHNSLESVMLGARQRPPRCLECTLPSYGIMLTMRRY